MRPSVNKGNACNKKVRHEVGQKAPTTGVTCHYVMPKSMSENCHQM